MKNRDKQLILHPEWQNKIPYTKPQVPEGLASKTITEISNAIDAHAYLDIEGKLWISGNFLHVILRTNKHTSKFILDSINKASKINIEGNIYVRGFEVMGLITKQIEDSGLRKRGKYLKFSEDCLRLIRDSDKAKALRGEYEEDWKDKKKTLKKQRIKRYKITHDELTGEVLINKTAEFSHIRSSSSFKELSLYLENGLIVNKETHDIITKEGIINEEELLFLCEKNKWDMSWYDNFKGFINKLS
jgi:hypothetical protein